MKAQSSSPASALIFALAACALVLSACVPSRRGPRRPLLSLGKAEDEPGQSSIPAGEILSGDGAAEALARESERPVARGVPVPPPPPTRVGLESVLDSYIVAPPLEREAYRQQILAAGDRARKLIEERAGSRRGEAEVYEALLRQFAGAPAPPIAGAEQSDPFLQDRYRLAADRVLSGDYLGGMRLAEALETLAPGSVIAEKARRLRRYAREQLVRDAVVAADLDAEDAILAQRELTAKLRLTNRSDDPILIRAAASEPSIGTIDLSFEALEQDGTRSTDQRAVPIKARSVISLKADNQFDLRLDLPQLHKRGSAGGFGRYILRGYLRPFRLKRGSETLPYRVPIAAVRVYVVDRDDLAFTEQPYASLLDALDELDGIWRYQPRADKVVRMRAEPKVPVNELLRRAFITAVLAGERKQEETFALIEKQLAIAPFELGRCLSSALSIVVGEPYQYSPEEWLTWLAKRKRDQGLRPRATPAKAPEAAGPKAKAPAGPEDKKG